MHKYIVRIAWTRKGIQEFENEINELMKKGWIPHGIEIDKGMFRYICMAMMIQPPDKCDCTCRCCIEMHHEQCDCDCDCCLQHAHRDGRYPSGDDEDE